MYTTIGELGPKIPYYRRNYGSHFPNGCICGPSGLAAGGTEWDLPIIHNKVEA